MAAASASSPNARTQAGNLEALRQLVLRDSPWYEALSLTHDQGTAILGEDATEYAAGHGSQMARRVAELALSSADVDVLKPVCVAFKSLFDAVKGATANREALVGLISHSVLVVKTVKPHMTSAQLSPGVRYALDSFIDQVNQVVDFAGRFGGQAKPAGRLNRLRRRIWRLVHHADDAAVIEQHAAKLSGIVAALTASAAIQSARDAAGIIEDVSKLKDTTVVGLRDVLLKIGSDALLIRRDAVSVGAAIAVLVAAVGFALRSAMIDVAAGNWYPVNTIEAVARTLEENSATLQIGTFLLVLVVLLVANVTRIQRSIKGDLQSLRPPPVPALASVPIAAMQLPTTFVERPSITTDIIAALTAKGRAIHALVGIGGCGKSSLASFVVTCPDILRYFRDGVFWVSVGHEGKHQLHARLQDLAREVGVAPGDWHRGMPPQFNDLDDVIGHLASFAKGRSCLLVLDNVWEAEVVRAARQTDLSLLVTTRDQSTVEDAGGTITFVGDMTTDEASAVLRRLSGTVGLPSSQVQEVIDQVARDCGYLPVALAIVGCLPSLKGRGSDCAAWRKVHEDLMVDKSRMQRAKGGAGESLGRVLDASFDALSSKKQEEFLRMAVFPKGVVASEDMLLNLWETEDLEETRDEARGLVSRSLLQAVVEGYRLHDLLLDFARDRIDSTALRKAISLQTQFLGRFNVIVAFMTQNMSSRGSEYSLTALWQALEQLSGDGELCIRTYNHCLLGLEATEPSEEVRLFVQAVGNLFQTKGRLDAAEPKLRKNLSISRQLYVPSDTRVWMAMLALGSLLGSKKTPESDQEAETLYRECLELCKVTPGGSDSSLFASVCNGLGLILSERKETAVEGEQLLRTNLKLCENLCGFMSTWTGVGRLNLAFNLRRQGKWAEAVEEHQAALKILEATCGRDHPLVLNTLNNYALLLGDKEKYEEAVPFLERCVDIGQRVLGSDHFEVAVWMENLASNYLHISGVRQSATSHQVSRDRCLERAETLLRKALKIRKDTFGSGNRLVMKTSGTLAWVMIARGNEEEGSNLLDSVDLQRVDTAVMQQCFMDVCNAGEMLRRQGKFPRAERIFQTILRHQPRDATTAHNLARLLAQQGKLGDAERMQILAINICEGEERPLPGVVAYGLDKAKMLRGMGIIKLGQGEVIEAETLFGQALTMREESAEAPPSSVAESLVDVAKVMLASARYTEAAALCSRASAIVEDCLGGHHSQVAGTLSVSAEIRRAQGDPEGALSLFERAVAIYERTLDANHPDLAGCRHHLGALLTELGMYNATLPVLERAYSARVAVFGASHDESVSSFTLLESVRSKIENRPEMSPTAPRHGQEGLDTHPQGT
ncbi:unnamed protein product [Scytosiphon promiscuus]